MAKKQIVLISNVKKYGIRLSLLVLSLSLFGGSWLGNIARVDATNFAPNRIIDNGVFDNSHTMDGNAIDAFLNTFPGSCLSANNGFSAVAPTGYSPSGGFTYGGLVSGGAAIAAAAVAYDINPQVLLATLQKEQSLVTGGAGCSTLAYSGATGYGCPDGGTTYSYSGVNLYAIHGVPVTSVSGTCVNTQAKVGFSQQLIHTAWLLKFGEQRSMGNLNWAIIRGSWNNSDDPQSCYGGPMTQGTFAVCPSGTTAYYDGYQTIDSTAVHMDTGATASLYWYTPHFHGNQVFFNTFVSWFGLPYSNDTNSPHPNGTLISESGRVYLLNNGARDYITNAAVFASYHYPWSWVKAATSGDVGLPTGPDINTLSPGSVFTAPGYPVFVMNYDTDGVLKKQHISLQAFNVLGYSWNDVMQLSDDQVPAATFTNTLYGAVHPAGALVASNSKVYLVTQNALQYVSPLAFGSYNYGWPNVKPATSGDMTTPIGTNLAIRQGTMVLAGGNIYDVDYSNSADPTSAVKRPIGPWECYANQMHYSSSDWFTYDTGSLPAAMGPNIMCD